MVICERSLSPFWIDPITSTETKFGLALIYQSLLHLRKFVLLGLNPSSWFMEKSLPDTLLYIFSLIFHEGSHISGALWSPVGLLGWDVSSYGDFVVTGRRWIGPLRFGWCNIKLHGRFGVWVGQMRIMLSLALKGKQSSINLSLAAKNICQNT
jgi:hypothetical protein